VEEPLHKLDLSKMNLEADVEVLIRRLLNHIEIMNKELEELKEEKQRLRDEVSRLKGEKGKPDVKGNKKAKEKLPREGSKLGAKKSKRQEDKKQRKERIEIDKEEVIELAEEEKEKLPADAKHSGYREITIQNIRWERINTRYRLERYYSASENKTYEAEIPEGIKGQGGYGIELQSMVITLYFEQRVPEEKIVEFLKSQGIEISAGQVSNILIKKHVEKFEEERKEVVKAGLGSTEYQHIDETGARVEGQNQYTTTVCNEHYGVFYTNEKKNKETVEKLLAEELKEELEEGKTKIEGERFSVGDKESTVKEEVIQEDITLREKIPILIADDAPQFHDQTKHRGLCWVHEDRHYKKLKPYFEEHQKLIEEVRERYWGLYRQGLEYKEAPTERFKQELNQAFDELFGKETGYEELDKRLELTKAKKEHMMLFLEFPEIPLDNNEAERALREFVVKRKISNGTRVKDGTKAWDVFLSLANTCRKQGVNFYQYIKDRISGKQELPSLASLIYSNSQTEIVHDTS